MNASTNQPVKKTPRKGWGFALGIAGLAVLGAVGHAEIQVKARFSPNLVIPDPGFGEELGQATYTVTINAGIRSITGVTSSVVLDSPNPSDPLYLGDISLSLFHGTALGGGRIATIFDGGSDPFDANATSLSATYSTAGLNGDWLASNAWTLLAADHSNLAVGRVASWELLIQGTSENSGIIDPGAGGEISMTGIGTQQTGNRANSTGTGASAVSLRSDSGQTLVFSDGLSGQGFRKTGDGVVEIQGNSLSYNGQVDVEDGKLVVSGILGSGSTLVVGDGGTLGGSGTVGALQIARGGVLAVGNSPGQMNAGATTWAGGAKYAWEVDDFGGNEMDFLAGQGTSYDFLNVTGALNVTAAGGVNDKFIIDVISLLQTSSTPGSETWEAGNAANFAALEGYSFAIAQASGGIQIGGAAFSSFGSQSAFDSALNSLFEIRTDSFSNASGSAGLWSISTASGGQMLLLNYNGGATAIPEPSSAALVVVGLGVLALRRRRCRR